MAAPKNAKEMLSGIKGSSRKVKGAPPRKNRDGNLGRKKQRRSRPNYWSSQRLRSRKVKRLMRHSGYTRAEAEKRWDATRTTRIKTVR